MAIGATAPADFQLKRRQVLPEDPKPTPSTDETVKFYSVADFQGSIMDHVRAVNAAPPTTLRDLAWALAFGREGASELEKLKAIFLWVATQDLFDETAFLRVAAQTGSQAKPKELVEALREPFNNRKSFTSTFLLLCQYAGLLVLNVGGEVKNSSFGKGSALNDTAHRHSWNLVFIDGKWSPIDVTFAASKLMTKELAFDDAVKEIEYFYFLAKPEYLAYSHHPTDPAHQLLATPVSTAQFRKWPILKPAFFKRGMKLHSPDSQVGVILDKSNLELHYLLPAGRAEEFSFVMRFEYDDGRDTFEGVKLSRYGIYELFGDQVQFHVRLPEASALYRLALFAKELTPEVPASAPHEQVAEYRMLGQQKVLPFPPLLSSAYGPTEHAVEFEIRALFDEPYFHTANGEGELRFVVGKNVRLTASLKTVNNVSQDALDRSVFTRTVVGEQHEGVVALHVPEEGEYGLEVYAYDPAVSPSGARTGTHVWSVFVFADAGSARHRAFPKLVRTFLGPQIDNASAELLAVGHDDPYFKVESAASQMKEVTLEFQLSHELIHNHEFKVVEAGEDKLINNFALGQLNHASNTLEYTLRFPKYGFFLFGIYGYLKDEDVGAEKLPSLYTYLIEVVPPADQDAPLLLTPAMPFPTQSAAWTLGCRILEPIGGVITKARQAEGPVRFLVEMPKNFDDRLIRGQVERVLLWSADLPPSYMHLENIGAGGPTETWSGEIDFNKETRSAIAIGVTFSDDATTARILLDYTVEK